MTETHVDQFYYSFLYQTALNENLKKVLICSVGPSESKQLLKKVKEWANKDYQRILDSDEVIPPDYPNKE